MASPAAERPVRGHVRYLAAAALAAALVLVGQVADVGTTSDGPIALNAAIAVAFTVLGAVVLVYLPGHAVGRLMVAAGACSTVAVLAVSWTGWLPAAWLAQWSWWPPFGLIFLALLVFPDGRLPARTWRFVAVLIASSTAVSAVLLAIAAARRPHDLLTDLRVPLSDATLTLLQMAAVGVGVSVVGLLCTLVCMVARWRGSTGDVRRQIECLGAAAAVLLVGLFLETYGFPYAWVIAAAAVPIGMATAILAYHLYDLDVVLNRTIVWLIMSVLVIAGFVTLVAILRQILFGDERSSSLAATGVLAATFQPVQRHVQHRVDHFLYGDRDDPYAVIARMGGHLEQTVEPNAVLPLLAATIVSSLQVPYVRVELVDEDGASSLAAEHGRPVATTESFPMVAHGRPVGRLLVAPRRPSSRFTSRECRLLRGVALQAAVAAEATRLTRDLQRSRERLVLAREEERRRLRGDLHDGIGPVLAGLSMQVRVVRRLLGGAGGGRAVEILDGVARDLQTCTREVRQLVDGLRPPALDHGLETALRAEAQRFCGPDLSVDVAIQGVLDELPAAVEVAAYRIVAEALTNVARHSRAHHALVDVRAGPSVSIDIVDDGNGIGAGRPGGTGLSSMRERAEALGGQLVVESAPPSGTRVRCCLPAETAVCRVG